jgi:hypothetical protein
VSAIERNVLLVGDEPERVEPFVPLLRRANLSVCRLVRPQEELRLAAEMPHDLIVVVPPVEQAGEVFARARAAGSPWRHASVLVVADWSARTTLDPALVKAANRLLAPSATPEEFRETTTELLEVEPRVPVRAPVEIRLPHAEGGPKRARVEDLSGSGMYLTSDAPLAVGTVFGFALELPSERDPILGQAGVVRKGPGASGSSSGVGVRFLSLGGDGAQRIDRYVRERRAAKMSTTSTGTIPVVASGVVRRPAASGRDQLEREHADLTALVDDLLRQGLARRLGATDWYLTGMEMGLESLHVFSNLLEAVHGGRAAAFETQNRIADLALVRTKLAEFALPQSDVRTRIRIVLELRQPLERLQRAIAEEGAAAGELLSARPPEAVSQVVAEIRRLVGAKKGAEALRALLLDLGATRHLFVPGAQRRVAERIWQEHAARASALGFAPAPRLAGRRERHAALGAVERELGQLGDRLAAIHETVFSRRFRHLATRNVEADLCDPKTPAILAEALGPGRDYVLRATSAYRHALEAAGADPGLLDRVARLAAALRVADLEWSGARRLAPRPAERDPSGAHRTRQLPTQGHG